jgi:hypothetical protein
VQFEGIKAREMKDQIAGRDREVYRKRAEMAN